MQKLALHRDLRTVNKPRKKFSKFSVLATAIIISCSSGALADPNHVKGKPSSFFTSQQETGKEKSEQELKERVQKLEEKVSSIEFGVAILAIATTILILAGVITLFTRRKD